MRSVKAWERNAENLRRSLSFYGATESRGGVFLITAEVEYAVFNMALLEVPVAEIDGEMERRVRLAGEHYGRLGRGWSFWVCESMVGERTMRRLPRIFAEAGMECIAESPGMEVEEMAAARRRLPELEYRKVGDRTTRSDFARIVEECFHIPTEVARRVYEGGGEWRSELEIWLGYEGGLAVTSAAVIEAGGAVGVYSVATLPGLRARGLAEAVMRHAVDDVRGRGAQGPLVLQSSPSGLELYRRLGFRRVTRYFVYATK